ncbi:Uncharacterized beta-barrel protein YwiB, DUF1934 family [Lentibacillus halodurans]|uniref:Uncharacterized beta-barrel protein YwiB, DUF1934 family n=1 Tax=Lentibacillus halodurans TaxID=237679 RepID=A0A1I0ZKI4_9BACI|nr:DUF1934 domain-containing protein [Lentibacillus halodurans]SFB25987.1 Uncharacterized beta-barrel protein YwiB, DUF1934 family [Lentibacillus halodurans]
MNKTPKQVAVELQTAIDDNGQMEYNTVRQTGRFYRKENMDVLTYNETADDGSPIYNMITILTDKVSVKRTGSISMHQQFRKQKTSENVFQHPHGNLHMETFTNTINYQALSEHQDGLLTIDYTVKLNGQDERKHQLTLMIRTKEDSQ